MSNRDSGFATYPCDKEIARLRADHAELLSNLEAMYDLLIEMRYLRSDEVMYPPYGVDGKPPLATSRLREKGFSDEVIDLMGQLPYPTNEVLDRWGHQAEGLPFVPDSSIISYLDGHSQPYIDDAREPIRDGEIAIPSWAFKIITCGQGYGNSYLYDTRLKTMFRWDSQSLFSEMWDQPCRSPSDAFNVLMRELRALDWIPWKSEVEGADAINVYMRPRMHNQHLNSLGGTNRYTEAADETLVEQSSEVVVLQQIIESEKVSNPILEALYSKAKSEGSIDALVLRRMAAEAGISLDQDVIDKAIEKCAAAIALEMVELSPNPQPPPGYGIAWVFAEIDKTGQMTSELMQAMGAIPSDSEHAAEQLRQLALQSGIRIPEIPAIPASLVVCSKFPRINRRFELARTVQNIFFYKRNLYEECGWPENFRGEEFDRRQYELEEELSDLILLLGPRGMLVENIEEGRYLREWYRQKAGARAF